MYKVNGEQCKKCGKLFCPDAKVFRPIDSNGNPLEMGLCDACEWNDMVEDIVEARHISHEEAEKFIYGKMHKAFLDIDEIHSIKPFYSKELIKNPWSRSQLSMLEVTERPNVVVRMVDK